MYRSLNVKTLRVQIDARINLASDVKSLARSRDASSCPMGTPLNSFDHTEHGRLPAGCQKVSFSLLLSVSRECGLPCLPWCFTSECLSMRGQSPKPFSACHVVNRFISLRPPEASMPLTMFGLAGRRGVSSEARQGSVSCRTRPLCARFRSGISPRGSLRRSCSS